MKPYEDENRLPWRLPVVALLISFLVFLIYSNTFDAPFQFDDTPNILENPNIKDLGNFSKLSGARYIGDLSFAINYAFGGVNVFGYHLVNILIHILNGILIYVLVLLLFQTVYRTGTGAIHESPLHSDKRDDLLPSTLISCPPPDPAAPWIALVVSLLFVSHPIQTQAVTYIVQRFTSLATFFYLLAVVYYLKSRLENQDRPIRFLYYGVSVFSAFLSMKTKEIAFTLPFMLAMMELMLFRSRINTSIKRLIPFILLVPIIPLSRIEVLGEAEGGFLPRGTAEITRWDYLLTQSRVIITYLRLMILPFRQNLDYDYPIYHSLFHFPVLFSLLFLGLFLTTGIYLINHNRSLTFHSRLIGFGILWFFITLSVESSIVLLPDMIFEHRMYLPSIGLLLAFSAASFWGFRTIFHKRPGFHPGSFTALICMILLFLSALTFMRNGVWKNDERLWKDVVDKSPRKARPHINLGVAYQNQERFDEAIEQYRIALEINPNDPKSHTNLGNIYKELGFIERGRKEYEIALEIKPDYGKAHNNLGLLFKEAGDIENAIKKYRIAIEYAPHDPVAHNNLANILTNQGRLEEAVEAYLEAIRIKPEYSVAHFNLGVAYEDMTRFDQAISEYQVVLSLDSKNAKAHNNLGGLYKQLGRLAESIAELKKAVKLQPDLALAHFNLGHAYLLTQQLDHAIDSFKKGLQIRPDPMAAFSLGLAFEQLEKYEEARAAYQEALKLNPTHRDSQKRLERLTQ